MAQRLGDGTKRGGGLFIRARWALCFALATTACGGGERAGERAETDSDGRMNAADQAVLGGFAVNAKALDAVGGIAEMLGNAGDEVPTGAPFCTATLIGRRLVVTAKHCVRDFGLHKRWAFVVGANGRRPEQIALLTTVDIDSSLPGDGRSGGADVALAHLDRDIDDVGALPLGYLDAGDIGEAFVGVGYGRQDAYGNNGQRRAGTLTLRALDGLLYERAYGDLPTFLAKALEIYELRLGTLGMNDEAQRGYLTNQYRSKVLTAGYQALVGNALGDSVSCHGDSGGPLLRRVDGKLTVFGVASWGQHTSDLLCGVINVQAVFGPAVRALFERSLSQEDPCGSVPMEGRCEGTVIAFCAGTSVIRMDCAQTSQTCVVGVPKTHAGGRIPRAHAQCVSRTLETETEPLSGANVYVPPQPTAPALAHDARSNRESWGAPAAAACGAVPRAGLCNGSVASRCVDASEAGPRAVSLDCAALGLVCAAPSGGASEVTCVAGH